MQHSQPQSSSQQSNIQANNQSSIPQSQHPQVITLQQLQNFLPGSQISTPQIHQLNASDAVQLQVIFYLTMYVIEINLIRIIFLATSSSFSSATKQFSSSE